MNDEATTPVSHQIPSAKDVAGVLVLFRWMGYAPAEGIQKANG